jgi:hypothetical protein
MATQYIENPETKEIIPFEWNKPTPPTSEDIGSLFRSVKGATQVDVGEAKRLKQTPELGGTITQAPPAWTPYARAGIEMAGYGLGTLAGLPFGGVPAFVSGPLGYAGARQLTKLLPGKEPPPVPRTEAEALYEPTFQEKALSKTKEVGTDVGMGMAMEAGGRLVSKIIPKVLPFYARGRTPGAEEVAEIAKREGVRIPAPDITASTTQAAIASSVQKLPQSAYTMQKESVNATGQFADYVERTLSKVGGRVEPFVAGQAGQEGRLIKLAENKATGTNFYNQAKDLAKDVEVDYKPLIQTINDIRSGDAYSLLSEQSKKEVDRVMSFIEGKIVPKVGAGEKAGTMLPPDVAEAVRIQAGMETKPTTYLEAEGMRKSIANKLFSKNIKDSEASGPIRQVYDSLQNVMEGSAKNAGSEAHNAFVNARDFWNKNVFGTFGERGKFGVLGQLRPFEEGGASPEKAILLLKNASLSDIKRVKASIPEEQFTTFRQGLLTQILQRNSTKSPITGEVIYNGPQIAKDLFGKSGLGEARLRELFKPEEFTFLRELSTVGERMGTAWRMAGNPSGTAHTLYILHLLGQVGSGVGAAVAGEAARRQGGTGAGLATAGAFLTPYAVAKLMTSNIGRQYLIAGFPRLEKAAGKMLPYAAIATRGLLSKPQEKETVTPPMNVDKELTQAQSAISRGAPPDKVKQMFQQRTGEEWPIK